MNTAFSNPIKSSDHRLRTFVISLGVAFALVAPTFLTTFASAAQFTQRSIQLSSSAKSATNVSYNVTFTAPTAAGAFVIDFCSNSPFIPSTCNAPTGMDASAAAGNGGFTDVTASTTKVIVAGTINAGDTVNVTLSGITNPSVAGPIYARIVSYDTKQHAINDYTSTDLKGTGSASDVKDQGAVAISITDSIGVSAAVLETMSFCVAGAAIGTNCNIPANSPPTIKLGQAVGSVVALDPTVVSTGNIYTQISTNAANGAIVSLKSSAASCGGLLRAGAGSACDISPAQNTDIAAGQARFGVKTNAATNGTGGSGTYEPKSGSYYNNSTYAMRYVNNTDGVTSPYGDQFLDTGGAPANNMNMMLTFAASAANNTPAGNYSADISLIATGTF